MGQLVTFIKYRGDAVIELGFETCLDPFQVVFRNSFLLEELKGFEYGILHLGQADAGVAMSGGQFGVVGGVLAGAESGGVPDRYEIYLPSLMK